MPEETLETPQPIPPVLETKTTNWPRIVLAVIFGFALLLAAAYAGYWYGTQEISKLKSQSAKPTTVAQPTPKPTPSPKPTPTPTQSITDPTANWKTYSSSGVSFKYPPDWVVSGYLINSTTPKIRLTVGTLMNECMQETAVENKGSFIIRKFDGVISGAMCTTFWDAPTKQIWVMKSLTNGESGIIYQYLSAEASQAESIFDQILSTFKFLD